MLDGSGDPTGDSTGTLGEYVQDITYGGGDFGGTDGSGNVDGVNNNVGQDMPFLEVEYNILYGTQGNEIAGTPPGVSGGLDVDIEQTFDLDLDTVFDLQSVEQTFEQNLDFEQDITVEVELIQDFTQTIEIEQTIDQPIAATGTRPAGS